MATPIEPDEVTVVISGKEFRFWQDLEIKMAVDAYSTVGFDAPFESDRKEFRDTFRPFSFQDMEILVGGDLLFTGTLVGVEPEKSPERRVVHVSAYALPGALQDCMEPHTALPLEFHNLKLRAIMSSLLQPFGIPLRLEEDDGAPFDKAAMEPDGSPHDFIVELARQRNLVLSNTPDGALLCWRSIEPGRPVARLNDVMPPVGRVSPSFNPQKYFSEITGFGKAKRKGAGSKWTERNPFLRGVTRPLSFSPQDTDPADVPEATRAKLGRMLANTASFAIEDIPTWRDPQGDLWRPNTTITLHAPDAFIFREYEFLVRAVTLRRTADSMTAAMELVFPGAFSGATPESMPWDEP